MPENAIRGYSWLVSPGPGFSHDPREVPWGGTPIPAYSWPIGPSEPGVRNRYGNLGFVALTETPLPPEIRSGWVVEPAVLDSDFDAAGARFIREAGFRETAHGRIQEAIFEVAGA
jgi:hypothetical protein